MTIVNCLDKIGEQHDKFIAKHGVDLFNRIVKLKKAMSAEINKGFKCDPEICKKQKGLGSFYRCCNVCEKTFGAYRVTNIIDILSKEDRTEISKLYSVSKGFHEHGLGCCLPSELRSFSCITHYCTLSIVSEKTQTLIGLYAQLITSYKKFIDQPYTGTYFVEAGVRLIEDIFEKMKAQESTSNWYSYYRSFYTDLKTKK